MYIRKRRTASSKSRHILSLPQAILHYIAKRTGPHSREVCKELLCAYGPLHTLCPRTLTSTRALVSTIDRWSTTHHIHTLDLTHVAPLITARTLALLPTAFPHLHTLILPLCPRLAPTSLSLLAPFAPTLTTLTLPPTTPASYSLPAITFLPNLQSLSLRFPDSPTDPLFSSQLDALTTLPHLSHLTIQSLPAGTAPAVAILQHTSTHLPNLTALHLDTKVFFSEEVVEQLAQHQHLTSLRLGTILYPWSGQVQQVVNGMTGLRHLQLAIDTFFPASQGLSLTHLSALESLCIRSNSPGDLDAALAAVAACPSLTQLHLGLFRPDPTTPLPALCEASLLALSRTIQDLHLEGFALPPTLLPSLHAAPLLATLSLASCTLPLPTDLSHLSALPSLHTLLLKHIRPPPPPSQLASLTSLTSLSLSACDLDDSTLPSLSSLKSLRRLSLPYNPKLTGSGCSVLKSLPFLEDLNLDWSVPHSEEAQVPRPPRLGSFCLGPCRTRAHMDDWFPLLNDYV